MPIHTIRKRNGQIVEFDRNRIESAVQKAFESVGAKTENNFFQELVDGVVVVLEERFSDRVAGVEDVQNVVEMAIADRGFFDVARSYIIYRYEHQREREQKQRVLLEKLENNELLVTKRSGVKERFSLEKLKTCAGYFVRGLEDGADTHTLAVQCRSELYEGITTKDIYRALVMTVRSFIEQDPVYSKLAARLLNHQVLQEVVGEEFDVTRMEQQYREAFVK
ncbi:MAG: ATP cone domain-containing protein, partial [bacterium]|nr:ATP cone domain-containing protein [bacterium]